MKRFFLFVLLAGLGIYLFMFFKGSPSETPSNPEPNPVKEKTTYLNKVYYNDLDIKDSWHNLIVKYLDLYYKSLKDLEKQDIKSLFKDNIYATLADNALDLVIQDRLLLPYDMKMNDISYDIKYKDIESDDDLVTITFLVTEYDNFNFIKDVTSKTYDVENIIVIDDSGDTIYSYRAIKDNYVMFTNELDMEDATVEDIENLKEEYIQSKKNEIEENKEYLEEVNEKEYEPSKECDHEYERSKAKAYAAKYANSRNDDYYDYSKLGGNCVNFVSQTIHAGGVPMDYYGDYQWKHYSSYLNYDNEPEGRTASWTATGYFYNYAKNNTGYGMCAEVGINPYYALAGDAFEVGYDGYTHGVVVVDRVKIDGKVVDVLINSNTVGLENYPLSAYTYFNKRLIKVLGYND